MKKTHHALYSMALCSLFAALITAGAYIKIPTVIVSVPVTMQGFFISVAALLLGAKKGTISVLLYIILGIIGFPVFTNGGDIGYIFKPSFGYILGFILCAFLTGVVKNKSCSLLRLSAASILGRLSIYIIALPYLYFMINCFGKTNIGLNAVFIDYFLIFLPFDIIFAVLAAVLSYRLIPAVNKLQ